MTSYQDVATSTATGSNGVAYRYRRVSSHLLVGLLPDTTVKIYADAGPGFLFQHHDEFGADVTAFLDADRETV